MKKNLMKKTLFIMLALFVMISLFAGCAQQTPTASTQPSQASSATASASAPASASSPAASSAAASTGKKIGFSLPTKELARCLKDAEYFEKNMKEKGYDVMIQFAEGDAQLQASQIENMITQGVSCLVISPWDGASLTQVVKLAHDNKIPVISYDALILNTPYIEYYVTDDLVKVGELQGQYIVDALGLSKGQKGPFNIELFAGDPADNNARFFFNGAMSKLNPYIDGGQLIVQSKQKDFSVTATPGWDGLKAQQRMDNLLSANYTDKKVDAVLCNNDGLALGVLSALKSVGYGTADKRFPVITGQDCDIANIKAIIAGEQSMTVFKDIRILSQNATYIVDSLMSGKTVDTSKMDTKTFDNGQKVVPTLFVPPVALDKTNYQKLLFDSGYYSKDLLK